MEIQVAYCGADRAEVSFSYSPQTAASLKARFHRQVAWNPDSKTWVVTGRDAYNQVLQWLGARSRAANGEPAMAPPSPRDLSERQRARFYATQRRCGY